MATKLEQGGYYAEPLTEENVDLLPALMERAFGRSVPEQYFRWKFLENPTGQVVGTLIRTASSGEPVTYYGLFPTTYRIGGQDHRVHHATDAMTHPEHRRRGLFVAACEATYSRPELKSDFIGIGFSSRDLVSPYLKLGWEQPFEIPLYFRPRALCILSGMQRREVAPIVPLRDAKEHLDMILAARKHLESTVIHSIEYLTWRLANPNRDYQMVSYGSSYAIFVNIDKVLFLVDFQLSARNDARPIMAAMEMEVQGKRMKGILTFAQRKTDFEDTLKAQGFLRNDFGRGPASHRIPFITWSQSAHIHLERSWSLTPMDHDAY